MSSYLLVSLVRSHEHNSRRLGPSGGSAYDLRELKPIANRKKEMMKTINILRTFAGALFVLPSYGCSSGEASSADTSADTSGSEVRLQCKRYVACVNEVTPDNSLTIAQAYGENGTCWKAMTEAQCEELCANATTDIVKEQDLSGVKDHTCVVKCTSDADCGGTTPACETKTGDCVGCLEDKHCEQEGSPVCSENYTLCVQCKSNSDCEKFTGGYGALVCDTNNERCVECTSTNESQCPNGCNTESGDCH